MSKQQSKDDAKAQAAAADTPHEELPHRLPPTCVPTHYELHLTPNLTTFKFAAKIDISLRVLKPSREIRLNTAELVVKSASITLAAANSAAIALTATYEEDDEVCVLTAGEEVGAGEGVLTIEYEGEHNDKMRGCYRSEYKSASGEKRNMIVTQFESTDARRAMPCWDEPAYKASFTLHLTTDAHLTAVSNMPEVSSAPAEGGLVTHSYDRSPVMSSYLYAWVVGEFDKIEDTTKDGTVVRVYTPVGKSEQGRFALECAMRILPFYNDFFKHKYPLPKLDMLAIPDFAAGAMENWGCVTYRTSAILIDPLNSSASTKQNVALTVTHEISHQWFGNLVTMGWWDGLWLNEGFATWMENYATAHLFPDWKMWDQFVYSDVNYALQLDSLLSSHPIEVPVERAEDVDEIFDAISYSKGSIVVRLLEGFLSIEQFQKGIQKYIGAFEYRNANTADLWAQLEQSSGKPVREMMEGWTKQVGYPLLTLSEGRQDGKEAVVFDVEQRRFLVGGPKADDDTLWFVPISFLTPDSGEAVSQQLLKERKGQLRLETRTALSALKWTKINALQTGFYRVHYPASMRAAFRDAIKQGGSTLTPADRLGLASDQFALARAALVPIAEVLEFVQAYEAETEYVVWADLLANLDDVADILKHTDLYDDYSAYVRALISGIVGRMGWDRKDSDDHCAALLRSRVLNAGVKYGDESVKAEAQRRFDVYFAAKKAHKEGAAKLLPADIRSLVYASVVKYGGAEGYEALVELGKLSDLHEEQTRCLQALAAAPDPKLTDRSLEYGFSSAVKSQDAPRFISALAGNRHASQRVWQYVQDNWKKVLDRYGGTTSMGSFVSIVDNFADEKVGDEAEKFFKEKTAPGAGMQAAQSIESLRSNAAYLKRDEDSIRQWLKKQQH